MKPNLQSVDWKGAPRALAQAALIERDRWALWLPLALAAGIGLYFELPAEPALSLGIGLGVAGVLIGVAAAITHAPWTRAAFALLAAILIGFSVAKLRTESVSAPVLSHRIGPVGFDGRVISAEAHGKTTRLLLEVPHIKHLASNETPARLRISVRNPWDQLTPGHWVHVTAVLMPPPDPATPGDYDFARWAFFQRIGAVGYAYGKAKPIVAPRPDTFIETLQSGLEDLRNRMTARIRDVIPGQEGAIAAALITGEQGAIERADSNAFRDSGLSHVLSISGLHLALAGGFFFWVTRALLALFPSIALRYPIKKWAAVTALFGAGLYLLISGCDSPAVRSYIMLATMFCGVLLDRPALSMRAIALAAILILLVQPENLTAPGFEMSFAAVTGLIAIAEWEQQRRAKNPDSYLQQTIFTRARRYVTGVALVSIVAGLATAPFSIFHFDRASQYGLLANLLAMPLVGLVIMPAATAAMVLMPFGLDKWALIVLGKGVGAMLAIAQWVASLPGAAAMVPVWPEWATIIVVFGGFWIALWRGHWRWLGLAPIATGLIFAFSAQPPDLLIARDGLTIAMRLADGKLALIRPPKDDYAAENWLRRDGDGRAVETAIAGVGQGVTCDYLGCRIEAPNGMMVSSITRMPALAEDCASSDIVISAVPTHHHCRGPKLVIDRFDVAKNGAYAIWLGKNIHIETAQAERGQRPWSMRKPKRRRNFNNAG